MKTMEKKATHFLNMMDYEFKTEEARQVLGDLYMRMFYYDIPTHEIEGGVMDIFNALKKEFEE